LNATLHPKRDAAMPIHASPLPTFRPSCSTGTNWPLEFFTRKITHGQNRAFVMNRIDDKRVFRRVGIQGFVLATSVENEIQAGLSGWLISISIIDI
jgi:hypothetical protein